MAKIRAFWPILRIPESAKLQIFVIFDILGFPKILQNGQNMGVLAYFADSGKRKIADFRDFDHFRLAKNLKNCQNKGFLAYFADSGKRKIADFRDF